MRGEHTFLNCFKAAITLKENGRLQGKFFQMIWNSRKNVNYKESIEKIAHFSANQNEIERICQNWTYAILLSLFSGYFQVRITFCHLGTSKCSYFLACSPLCALFWCSFPSLAMISRRFLQLLVCSLGQQNTRYYNKKYGWVWTLFLRTHARVLVFWWWDYSLPPGMSLQGGEIPLKCNCEHYKNWENQQEREYVCCQEIDEAKNIRWNIID